MLVDPIERRVGSPYSSNTCGRALRYAGCDRRIVSIPAYVMVLVFVDCYCCLLSAVVAERRNLHTFFSPALLCDLRFCSFDRFVANCSYPQVSYAIALRLLLLVIELMSIQKVYRKQSYAPHCPHDRFCDRAKKKASVEFFFFMEAFATTFHEALACSRSILSSSSWSFILVCFPFEAH